VSSLPAHLELIVEDARAAAARTQQRSRRRRRGAAALTLAVAALAIGIGVAGAVGGPSYVDLVRAVYPDARVSDLGDRQQQVIADLGDGIGVDLVVTDLGLTGAEAPAPAGAGTCDWDAAGKLLHCSSAGDRVTIPAGTHVYRVQPRPQQPGAQADVMYVPALRLELLVDPSPAP